MDNPCQSGPISRTERERTINLGGNRNARSGSEGTSAGEQRGPAAPCSGEKAPRQKAQSQKDKKHDYRPGGGGGSGYVGGVTSYGIYKNVTQFSDNQGCGRAAITLIQFIELKVRSSTCFSSYNIVYLCIVLLDYSH